MVDKVVTLLNVGASRLKVEYGSAAPDPPRELCALLSGLFPKSKWPSIEQRRNQDAKGNQVLRSYFRLLLGSSVIADGGLDSSAEYMQLVIFTNTLYDARVGQNGARQARGARK